jgi:hypothetical protein
LLASEAALVVLFNGLPPAAEVCGDDLKLGLLRGGKDAQAGGLWHAVDH